MNLIDKYKELVRLYKELVAAYETELGNMLLFGAQNGWTEQGWNGASIDVINAGESLKPQIRSIESAIQTPDPSEVPTIDTHKYEWIRNDEAPKDIWISEQEIQNVSHFKDMPMPKMLDCIALQYGNKLERTISILTTLEDGGKFIERWQRIIKE